MGEDINERTADDQILFYLRIIHPRCLIPPFRDVVSRDYMSGSSCALTMSVQSCRRCPLRFFYRG